MPFEVTERNASALEPLFKPWEEPLQHRLPNPERGKLAIIAPGRHRLGNDRRATEPLGLFNDKTEQEPA